MSKTSVASDLLHSLEIVSELGVQTVGDKLTPVAVSDVSLSVQEPLGDVVVYKLRVRHRQSLRISNTKSGLLWILTSWLGEDIVDLFNLLLGELSSSIHITHQH